MDSLARHYVDNYIRMFLLISAGLALKLVLALSCAVFSYRIACLETVAFTPAWQRIWQRAWGYIAFGWIVLFCKLSFSLGSVDSISVFASTFNVWLVILTHTLEGIALFCFLWGKIRIYRAIKSSSGLIL